MVILAGLIADLVYFEVAVAPWVGSAVGYLVLPPLVALSALPAFAGWLQLLRRGERAEKRPTGALLAVALLILAAPGILLRLSDFELWMLLFIPAIALIGADLVVRARLAPSRR
jgi:hypothetical protein